MTIIAKKVGQNELGKEFGRSDGAIATAVVLLDPTTGEPMATLGGGGGAGLTDTQLRATAVPTADKNGEGAVTYITGTTPVTGLAARHVMCLTDTTFATFTRTNATGSITGVLLPAGTLLTGPVTAITLTSGAVAAYA